MRDDSAAVRYRVEPGPPCVFGEATVSGLEDVEPEVVRREVAFTPGEPFEQELLDKTRRNLDALRLFRSVRLIEDESESERSTWNRARGRRAHEVMSGGHTRREGVRGIEGWATQLSRRRAPLGFPAHIRSSSPIAVDFRSPNSPRNKRMRLVFLQSRPTTTRTICSRPAIPAWMGPSLRPDELNFYRARTTHDRRPAQLRLALPDADPSGRSCPAFGFGIRHNAPKLVNPNGAASRARIDTSGWRSAAT